MQAMYQRYSCDRKCQFIRGNSCYFFSFFLSLHSICWSCHLFFLLLVKFFISIFACWSSKLTKKKSLYSVHIESGYCNVKYMEINWDRLTAEHIEFLSISNKLYVWLVLNWRWTLWRMVLHESSAQFIAEVQLLAQQFHWSVRVGSFFLFSSVNWIQ